MVLVIIHNSDIKVQVGELYRKEVFWRARLYYTVSNTYRILGPFSCART